MRNAILITPTLFLAPTLFLTLIAAPGCKDDPAPNEPGEFGEPCLVGEASDSPDGCASGKCYLGYCEEYCTAPEDCQPVDGWERTCGVDLCHIVCDENGMCPQNLGTPLVCGLDKWCKSEEFE